MAIEIERKFLVTGDGWRDQAIESLRFEQGYLCGDGPASVRVRIEGDHANINIKAAVIGTERAEYEYAIPLDEAREILSTLTVGACVSKTRHWVAHGDHTWEIDVFEGRNAPLVVAEIELDAADESFQRPDWLGEEVSSDKRYYNHALAFAPYGEWSA